MTSILKLYFYSSQKQNPSSIAKVDQSSRSCESCNSTQTTTWYLAHIQNQDNLKVSQPLTSQSQLSQQHQQLFQQATSQARLCNQCWIYWRKYGAFKCVGQRGGRHDEIDNA